MSLLACACAGACASDPERIAGDLSPQDLILPPREIVPQPELPDGLRVRIATFNVHGFQDATPAAIGDFLAASNLDLAALEECPRDGAAEVAARAGFSHFDGDGTVILAKAPLVGFETVALETRSYAHATTDVGGIAFSVYAAHIGWNAAGSRQARLLVQHLALDANPYLLLAGDFNDEHYSAQITILEAQLTDVFTKAHLYPGDLISWPATGFDGNEGSQLIDLIFFRPELGTIVVDAKVHNLAPVLSDHKPVIAELLFPTDPSQPFLEDPFAGRRGEAPEFPPEDRRPPNLLLNPGAEEDLSGWTMINDARTEAMRSVQSPRSGSRLFTGAPLLSIDDPALSFGTQRVDLASNAAAIDEGRGILLAEAYVATGFETEVDGDIVSNRPRPYDDGEIIIELFDGTGSPLSRHASGRRDTLRWHPRRAEIPLPPGTRAASFIFAAYRKHASGQSNDAVFDDLYLGFSAGSEHTRRIGRNLLENNGGELGSTEGWTSFGARALRDQEPLTLMLYPPWTYSGSGHFVAGDGLEDSVATLEQELKLEAPSDSKEELALRWGGALRTYAALGTITLMLEIFDGDGSRWGVVAADPVAAAEWTWIESLTRIPRGVSRIVMRLEATLPIGEWAFADELYAHLERPPP